VPEKSSQTLEFLDRYPLIQNPDVLLPLRPIENRRIDPVCFQ
jgi:hypothetical protein